MTPLQCLHILGLGEAASISEIKQAYHRLALENHPDRNAGDERARRRFIAVVSAYRTLSRLLRHAEAGRQVGECFSCRRVGEVLRSLDGNVRCPRCAVNAPSRLLPMPTPVVVRCLGSLVLFMLATVFLLLASWNDKFSCALVAFALGGAGLATLAYTCLTVLHCAHVRKPERAVRVPAQRLR